MSMACLLELTRAEEDAFFVPFERRYGLKDISRDWNSYAIRNDENIIAEILRPWPSRTMNTTKSLPTIWTFWDSSWKDGTIETITIPGARSS